VDGRPAHDDRSPSLSINERNGKILLYCHAGCSTEAVCAGLGIKMSELFSEPRMATNREPHIVRAMQRQIATLRSQLTPRDRERPVTVVPATTDESLDAAIVRALVLAVEGELVQVMMQEGPRRRCNDRQSRGRSRSGDRGVFRGKG
jgi:hypothetical protein